MYIFFIFSLFSVKFKLNTWKGCVRAISMDCDDESSVFFATYLCLSSDSTSKFCLVAWNDWIICQWLKCQCSNLDIHHRCRTTYFVNWCQLHLCSLFILYYYYCSLCSVPVVTSVYIINSKFDRIFALHTQLWYIVYLVTAFDLWTAAAVLWFYIY